MTNLWEYRQFDMCEQQEEEEWLEKDEKRTNDAIQILCTPDDITLK